MITAAKPPILPDVIFDQHLAIVAKTGAGKTFTAKGFVERLLDLGRRVCIIDPTGVWWGLKSSADGKRAGYPVAILGGLHGDMPIVDTSGAAVAELIATRNLPAIVDLSEMLIGQRHRFVTDFAETLHRLNRQVLHLVIDEADEVAPQNPLPETKRMLHQIDRIVRRGRVRGFRVIMITQRPAVLHKNVLGSANTLIVMRLTLPHDRRAVEDWIKYQADLSQGKDVLATLARLPMGEGWVWSPEHDLLQRVMFPPIKTFDSSRAPEPGDELAAPATLAEVDLSGIRDALAEAERAAAENDPKLLRKRIAELERDAKRQQPADADPAAIERAREEGYAAGYQAGRLAAWHAAADDLHRLEEDPPCRRSMQRLPRLYDGPPRHHLLRWPLPGSNRQDLQLARLPALRPASLLDRLVPSARRRRDRVSCGEERVSHGASRCRAVAGRRRGRVGDGAREHPAEFQAGTFDGVMICWGDLL